MDSSGSPLRPARRENNTPIPNSAAMTKVFGGPHDFQISIHYPSRFQLNRLATVRVVLSPVEPVERVLDFGKQTPNAMLPVRLVIPGALVSPSEAGLAITPFASTEARFHVAPAVVGILPDARLELTRDGQFESIALPMRSQGNGWLIGLLACTILLPLLLYLPSWRSDWVSGFETGLPYWLPNLPVAANIARPAQKVLSWLATRGAELHLSFFSLLALAALTAGTWFNRRSRVTCIQGAKFTLGAPPRPIDPPKYLTPVPAEELTRPADRRPPVGR